MRRLTTCGAIILASFGSADDAIRAATFDAFAAELKNFFPAFEVRQAFTSNFMIRKLSRRGIFIDTPAEAIADLRGARAMVVEDSDATAGSLVTFADETIDRLKSDGVRKIFLLPTHLTAGEEFDNKIKICAAPDVEIVPPLLSLPIDKKIFATILDCYPRAEDEDLILVGHGSPHKHNPVYENLQHLAGAGVHIGVIESNDTPNFADVVKRLELRRAEKILLAPLLFNGGVHVTADIAGENDSWLTRLIALGYRVRVIRDGLGTFEKFRKLYIDKLRERIENIEQTKI